MRVLSFCLPLALVAIAGTAHADAPFVPFPVPAQRAVPSPPLPQEPPDLRPFLGRPVTRIEVLADGAVPWVESPMPQVTAVWVGHLLSQQTARAALDDVLKTGRFAHGHVSVAEDGNGVRLQVRVVPRRLVASVKTELHGVRFDRDELLREADLAVGSEVVATELDERRVNLTNLLARRGYPNAHVTLRLAPTANPLRVAAVIDVAAGAERLIQRRWFYLNGASAEAVQGVLDGYLVGVGARADETALANADTRLEDSLRALGYVRASVWHDVGLSSALVSLRVRVNTGPLSIVSFEGNASYDADALGAAIDAERDPDRSPSHLTGRLRAFYQKRGFLDVDVTVETRGKDGDSVRPMVFKIVENARVRVATRAYPCLSEAELRPLDQGGPRTTADIGAEIDSFLEEEFPGTEVFKSPSALAVDRLLSGADGPSMTGARRVPLELDPRHTFVEDTYERAVGHIQELYRNEGYLQALVGPLSVLRARCDRKSPPGRCTPMPLAKVPSNLCTYDPSGLPLPTVRLGPEFHCEPDRARGLECAPRVDLLIPIKLGPRTRLYDVAFLGVYAFSEQEIFAKMALPLGKYASLAQVEDARKRAEDAYKEEGYAYVEAKTALELSLDRTRARLRVDVQEGERVYVRGIEVRGNTNVRAGIVQSRITLRVGEPYRLGEVRKTQEYLATLGVFSSIDVSLEDPYIPQRDKVVIITVSERMPQYFEVRP
ncbi:MAG: POTRA domain-containing protein, partial [Myxococcales bacterium]